MMRVRALGITLPELSVPQRYWHGQGEMELA